MADYYRAYDPAEYITVIFEDTECPGDPFQKFYTCHPETPVRLLMSKYRSNICPYRSDTGLIRFMHKGDTEVRKWNSVT